MQATPGPEIQATEPRGIGRSAYPNAISQEKQGLEERPHGWVVTASDHSVGGKILGLQGGLVAHGVKLLL